MTPEKENYSSYGETYSGMAKTDGAMTSYESSKPSTLESVKGVVSDATSKIGDAAKSAMDDVTSKISETAKNAYGDVASKIGEVAEPLKEKATAVAKDKVALGVDQMQVVANAVHGAACELESQMPRFANYIHDAGNRIEGAASNLRESNLEEMLDGFNDFAKQQPALVFGAAALAGFALARFLKSSGSTMITSSSNTYAEPSYAQPSYSEPSYSPATPSYSQN